MPQQVIPSGGRISPTQLATAGKCGWAYEYQYVRKLRPPSTPVPLLTGSVLHNAREKWIMDHSLDMVDLTKKAWRDLASETPLFKVVTAYEKLADKSRNLCKEIMLARPDIKAPERTKDYKQSETGRLMAQFENNRRHTLAQDKHDWSDKSFTAVYNETLNRAEAYQDFYRDDRPALRAEFKYVAIHAGLELTGVIDDLRLLMTEDGEPVAYAIVDAKTYGNEPEPMKDFLQLASYNIVGLEQLPMWLDDVGHEYIEGLPIIVGLDLMALLKYEWYQFAPEQLDIATSLMLKYDQYRQGDTRLPNFKGKCDWCEWAELCRNRVGMTPLKLEGVK